MSMMMGQGRNSGNPAAFPQAADVIRLWDSGTAWEQLNPAKDTYNWAPLDNRISENLAQANPKDLIYCFGRTPAWAALPVSLNCSSNYDPTANAPADQGAVAEFRDAFIARYKGSRIKYFETWNEWNACGFYAGTLAQLVAQQATLYSALHAAGFLVTTPTPCLQTGPNGEIYSQWPTADVALAALFANSIQFDIVTFHGYLNNGIPAQNIESTLWNIQQVMSKYGYTNPLFDTEYGPNNPNNIASGGPQRYWVWESLMKRMAYGLALSCWYQWDNSYTQPVTSQHGTCINPDCSVNEYGKAWSDFYYSMKIGMKV